jgi:hypothetical protein
MKFNRFYTHDSSEIPEREVNSRHMSTVVGIFDSKDDAEFAVEDLKEFGFQNSDISVIMKEQGGYVQKTKGSKGGAAFEGLVTGATSGGVIGGLAGLLIGIGAIAIPGVGPLLVAGPLAVALGLTGAAAATVSGAATGIVAGGLVGSLVGIGLPQDVAYQYEQRLREGGVLLAVPVEVESDARKVEKLFALHNAMHIRNLERN